MYPYFIPFYGQVIFHYKDIPHEFIHLSIDGHFGCFYLLAIMIIMNKHSCISFWFFVCFFCFFCFFLNKFIYFIYSWLRWVFAAAHWLSLVVASGGHPSLRYADLSLRWPLFLRSTGSRRAGSVVVAHGLSCSAACEIFPDQGSNPCPLHWQADSQPLRHQGSPHA